MVETVEEEAEPVAGTPIPTSQVLFPIASSQKVSLGIITKPDSTSIFHSYDLLSRNPHHLFEKLTKRLCEQIHANYCSESVPRIFHFNLYIPDLLGILLKVFDPGIIDASSLLASDDLSAWVVKLLTFYTSQRDYN